MVSVLNACLVAMETVRIRPVGEGTEDVWGATWGAYTNFSRIPHHFTLTSQNRLVRGTVGWLAGPPLLP